MPLTLDGSALASHLDATTGRACHGAHAIPPAADLTGADFERITPPAGNLPPRGYAVAAQVGLFALDLFNPEP